MNETRPQPDLPGPVWCPTCGIPHAPDATACSHCGRALATTLPSTAARPAGGYALAGTADVEARSAAIVARAQALDSRSGNQVLAAPQTLPAAPQASPLPTAPPPAVSAKQRVWLIAGLLLCVIAALLILAFARQATLIVR